MPTEHDYRQYILMLNSVRSVKRNINSLGEAISSLEGLLHQLEQPDREWAEEFQDQWWTLEEIYAVSLSDDGTTFINETDKDSLMKALDHLEVMIGTKVADIDK